MKINFQNINPNYSIYTRKENSKYNYYATTLSSNINTIVQPQNQVSFKALFKRLLPPKPVIEDTATVIKKMKKYFPIEYINKLIDACKNPTTNKIIPGCLNSLEKLARLGFNDAQIYEILDWASYNYKNSEEYTDFKLTENLPEFKNDDNNINLAYFIERRITASSDRDTFKEDRYELFNTISRHIQDPIDLKDCIDLTCKISRDYNPKEKKDFFEILEKRGLIGAIEYNNAYYNYNHKPHVKNILMNTDIEKANNLIKDFNYYNILSKISIEKFIDLYNSNRKCENFGHTNKELMLLIYHCHYGKRVEPKIFEFIKENLSSKLLVKLIPFCKTKDFKDIDRAKFEMINKLYHECNIPIEHAASIIEHGDWKDENLIENIEKTKQYYDNFGTNVYIACYKKNYPVDKLLKLKDDLIKIALEQNKKKEQPISKSRVKSNTEEFLFRFVFDTIVKIRLLGEENILKLAEDQPEIFYRLWNLIDNIPKEDAKTFINIIQPETSERFQEIENEIKTLKSNFKKEEDNSELIKKLKELNAEKRIMLNKKIKDPVEIIKLISLYTSCCLHDKDLLEKMLPYIGSNLEEDKNQFNALLNEHIKNKFKLNIKNPVLKNEFDFKDSKYLYEIAVANEDYIDSVQNLANVLDKNYTGNIQKTLNSLPANINTRKAFEANRLKYDVWTDTIEDLKVEITTTIKANKAVHNAIKALEEDFNSDNFVQYLPQKEKDNLSKFLFEKGFSLKPVKTLTYDNNGFFEGEKTQLKIFKNDNEINIQEALEFINLFKEYTENSDFWGNNINYKDVTGTLTDHIIKRRLPEIQKAALTSNKAKVADITINKVDMNNIKKALFLGNDAGCCTATDGINSWTAGNYILNNCIQAIEIKKGDQAFGNTMCFIANVNGSLSLILDNVEIKSELQYSEDIKTALIEFAHKLCTKLGRPNMNIYLGANRHLLNFDDYEVVKNATIKIIGETDGLVYVDCLDGEEEIKSHLFKHADLIKVTD